MKLEIPLISLPATNPTEWRWLFCQMPEIPIDKFPWGKIASLPRVAFKIAHNQENIFLFFHVCEEQVLARYTRHNDPVYTDSCVEFFIAFGDEPDYYNFEFNSLGTCLAAWGPDRHQRERANPEKLNLIQTQTIINRVSHYQLPCFEWQLSIKIPVSSFFKHQISQLSEKTARANFYKCGDDLDHPHFLCWQTIKTPDPDFHQPFYFGEIGFL
ncbi:carbohydrate-binding family 9-like protein [Gaoshiqia sp. Z1-71]|uniref:carbohydrate-binding family 9-like protein n=1 Tax=Gaoshiqia hydrogeniformans TaxID=3290090 RepID=UPI003BF79598